MAGNGREGLIQGLPNFKPSVNNIANSAWLNIKLPS